MMKLNGSNISIAVLLLLSILKSTSASVITSEDGALFLTSNPISKKETFNEFIPNNTYTNHDVIIGGVNYFAQTCDFRNSSCWAVDNGMGIPGSNILVSTKVTSRIISFGPENFVNDFGMELVSSSIMSLEIIVTERNGEISKDTITGEYN
jgi:hypothetical protein